MKKSTLRLEAIATRYSQSRVWAHLSAIRSKREVQTEQPGPKLYLNSLCSKHTWLKSWGWKSEVGKLSRVALVHRRRCKRICSCDVAFLETWTICWWLVTSCFCVRLVLSKTLDLCKYEISMGFHKIWIAYKLLAQPYKSQTNGT